MRKFIKEFKVELIFGVAALIGIILVVTEVDVMGWITNGAVGLVANLTFWFSRLMIWQKGISSRTLILFFLGVASIIFVLWRIRWRFMQSDLYRGRVCPKCGLPLNRIHRTKGDIFLSKLLFLPLSRYQCRNDQCNWTGIRKPGRRRKQEGE